MNAPQILSAEAISSIVASIPPGADTDRQKLLAEMLHSWSENELGEYAGYADRSKDRPVSKKLLDDIHKTATTLETLMQQAVAAGDIEYLGLILKPRRGDSTISDLVQAVEVIRDASGKAAGSLARGRGQPQNIIAHLVMGDIANIYEWLYQKKAARVFDWERDKETGPFWRFASIIWGEVFGAEIKGLSAAAKAFTAKKNKSYRASPVVHNTLTRILHDAETKFPDGGYSAKKKE